LNAQKTASVLQLDERPTKLYERLQSQIGMQNFEQNRNFGQIESQSGDLHWMPSEKAQYCTQRERHPTNLRLVSINLKSSCCVSRKVIRKTAGILLQEKPYDGSCFATSD
jgi:hypothetical protein